MKCQKCGAEVPAGSKFCNLCGEKIEQVALFKDSDPKIKESYKCDNCGKEIPNNSVFCPECHTYQKNNFTPIESTEKTSNKKPIYQNANFYVGLLIAVILIVTSVIAIQQTNIPTKSETEPETTEDYYENDDYNYVYKEETTEKSYYDHSYDYYFDDEEDETEPTTKKVTKGSTKKSIKKPTDPPAPKIVNNTSSDGFWANGNGDYVAEGLNVTNYAVLHISHTGSRNFIVKLYKDDEYEDLLVNTIGSYTGDVLVEGSGTYELEISADGDWNITSDGLSIDDTTSFSGTGDSVTGITSHSGGSWHITYSGERNFSVIEYGESLGYMDLLVNEIGSYDGTVKAESGDNIFFKVHSYGNWTIKKK